MVKFSNIDRNITRTSWSVEIAKARYIVMMGYSTAMDHLFWIQVTTDSSSGNHNVFVQSVINELAESSMVPSDILDTAVKKVGLAGVSPA